jgi:hypothetical protein
VSSYFIAGHIYVSVQACSKKWNTLFYNSVLRLLPKMHYGPSVVRIFDTPILEKNFGFSITKYSSYNAVGL